MNRLFSGLALDAMLASQGSRLTYVRGKRMKKLFFTMVAVLAASPAAAEDWRLASASVSETNSVVSFVDRDSIVRDGDTVRFLSDTRSQGIPGVDELLEVLEASCSAKSHRSLRSTMFLNGSAISRAGPQETKIAPAGSSIAGLIDRVCTGKLSPTTVVDKAGVASKAITFLQERRKAAP
ncbi:MAG TPA: hypothetical protein VGB70_11250 [Allosphingosinicella sp.]